MPKFKTGQWLDGAQLIAQAPVSYSRAESRAIDGHLVNGNYSDPWWAYNPETKKFFLVRTWRKRKTWYDTDEIELTITEEYTWSNV